QPKGLPTYSCIPVPSVVLKLYLLSGYGSEKIPAWIDTAIRFSPYKPSKFSSSALPWGQLTHSTPVNSSMSTALSESGTTSGITTSFSVHPHKHIPSTKTNKKTKLFISIFLKKYC